MPQQPLLRKIHSRSTSGTHPIAPTTTTSVSQQLLTSPPPPPHRSNHHHHHHHLSNWDYLLSLLSWWQPVPGTLWKYTRCVVTTLPHIVRSLLTMDTLIGIKVGIGLFMLLQSLTHANHRHTTTTPSSTTVVVLSSSTSSSSSVTSPTTSSPIVIGYAVSITGCGRDPITEGAAILQHSIHRNSVRRYANDSKSSSMGRYDYQMYAIYHPSAKECAMTLTDLGYTLLERETPVPVSEIQGEYLRTNIAENGCCGEKELIKLYAYTLTQHPIVVHLDLDTILVQPLDTLFDYMLLSTQQQHQQPSSSSSVTSSTTEQHQIHQRMKEMVMWPDRFPPLSDTTTTTTTAPTTTIDAMFTYDYNMVNPHTLYKPVQGGFLLLRPNQSVYEEFQQLIRMGDFRPGSGWGGQVGPFYGSMTFQGIIPYYYDILHPHQSLELNRCYINTMADNPRTKKTVDNVVDGPCRTGQPEDQCQDCRTVPLSQIYTVHYTICQKPWSCLSHNENILQHELCRTLTHEWYHIRYDYQNSEPGDGTYDVEQFYGYCRQSGSKGYIPIPNKYYPAAKVLAATANV